MQELWTMPLTYYIFLNSCQLSLCLKIRNLGVCKYCSFLQLSSQNISHFSIMHILVVCVLEVITLYINRPRLIYEIFVMSQIMLVCAHLVVNSAHTVHH